ncbi:MAG: amidohydrolase, partial [Candidatus Krumholzibacteria bacterium]|nr:amidohydrolase [Candidatus Krumholzibacteria bacterium]
MPGRNRPRTAAFSACACALAAALWTGGAMSAQSDHPRVDAVFHNGIIYTMDDARPRAGAVAVCAGRILAVGDTKEILALAGAGAERYDLGGRCVIPGLVDAHTHFSGYALSLASLDLAGTASLDEVVGLVAERAAAAREGEWVTGRGWDQNDWDRPSFPHRRDIDRACAGHPALLVRVCGHAALAGSAALEAAGIGRDTPDPPGGRIVRDADGEATGLLLDEAIELVRRLVPETSQAQRRMLFAKAARNCLAAGLTGVHEMGIGSRTAALYEELCGTQELPLRVTAYWSGEEGDLDSLLAAGPSIDPGGWFSIVGVKLFMDGSLGARSAALLEDYADDPGNRGILVADPGALRERVLACHRSGFQVAIHAIGDRANRIVLDIYGGLPGAGPAADRRHRIEHAQILDRRDIGRFAELGVIPSMQFTHCTSDMPWAGDRLGPERLAGAYAWRSLLETGCRIPGGSDFPVESIDPMLGIWAAVTRSRVDGT